MRVRAVQPSWLTATRPGDGTNRAPVRRGAAERSNYRGAPDARAREPLRSAGVRWTNLEPRAGGARRAAATPIGLGLKWTQSEFARPAPCHRRQHHAVSAKRDI